MCGIKGYAHVGTYVRAAHTSWVVYLTIHQVEGSLVLDIRESRNIWCLLLHILYLGWVIYSILQGVIVPCIYILPTVLHMFQTLYISWISLVLCSCVLALLDSERELVGFTPIQSWLLAKSWTCSLSLTTLWPSVRGKKRRRGISPGCPSNRYTTRKALIRSLKTPQFGGARASYPLHPKTIGATGEGGISAVSNLLPRPGVAVDLGLVLPQGPVLLHMC